MDCEKNAHTQIRKILIANLNSMNEYTLFYNFLLSIKYKDLFVLRWGDITQVRTSTVLTVVNTNTTK